MSDIKIIKLSTIPKDELQKIINESSSNIEILKKLGYNSYNGTHRTLKKRIEKDNLDLTIFEENRKNHKKEISLKHDTEDVLVPNSKYNRCHLKKRLVNEGLLEYKCQKCGNTCEWQGEKLTLQLDHIDGINDNNSIENLRFLCPNCHAQTDTYAGKRLKKDRPTCTECGIEISLNSVKCKDCNSKYIQKTQKKFTLSKADLEKLFFEDKMTYSQISKQYSCSVSMLRKYTKKYGIKVRDNKNNSQDNQNNLKL
jgi:predicted RNA-binding Zn-ribbon protein involved in translation (DUF1610 family)